MPSWLSTLPTLHCMMTENRTVSCSVPGILFLRFRANSLIPALTVPYLLFFFFQAEDGIRDTSVTGVQTCALPISRDDDRDVPLLPTVDSGRTRLHRHQALRALPRPAAARRRSDRRRGGPDRTVRPALWPARLDGGSDGPAHHPHRRFRAAGGPRADRDRAQRRAGVRDLSARPGLARGAFGPDDAE